MKTYKIHLIRHGLEKPEGVIRYVGKTDLPLTARGKEHKGLRKQKQAMSCAHRKGQRFRRMKSATWKLRVWRP